MIDYLNCRKHTNILYESYFNRENSPCNGIENVNIIVHKKKLKKRKKCKVIRYTKQPTNMHVSSSSSAYICSKHVQRRFSMPEINACTKFASSRSLSSHQSIRQSTQPFKSNFIVNIVSEHHFDKCLDPFSYASQTKWKVYRCQIGATEESCCCSCNSDAMFEVMKSLYDCYKKKNCDNCDCILCGHLQREERRQGEIRKSLEADTVSAKERKEKIKKAEKLLDGKTPAQKEIVLKDLAKTRQPLPEGRTASEKSLVKKVKKELGLPPEPKSAEEKMKMRRAEAAGIVTPLEGKAPAQKEKILRAQAAAGIPLPEGRSPSERALIQKIKAVAGIPSGIPSEKLRKAKAAGIITPLDGKTPEQKDKIIRGLATHGIPLPEAKTPSEKKLIDKVRTDLGLPPEPKNKSMRDKYAHAANAGLLQPLEGKSPDEKEKILQGLADLGIPLPEGRTPSEKALATKVKARSGRPLDVLSPSEKFRKAKAAGVLTPIAGKPPDQKEKILRGLAMHGIPLPELHTPSDKKLLDKVRLDLGLPPEPKTKAIRDKHNQAANVGLLLPLEAKTPAQKEKILQGIHNMDIPLPEGRTPSEKALIAKIKAGPRALSAVLAPSDKMKRAKAEGLLTPLKGKSPDQREKILRGLAMLGIPLPEGQTPSEKKLTEKVRTDLGLPPEPQTPEIRGKHVKAADVGLLLPLEGKTPKEKERILQGLNDMDIPLPEGRTPSEKALVAKIRAGRGPPLEALPHGERMRRAKAAGFITPLAGKTAEQKQKILKGLAMHGLPFPEIRTPSEKKLVDKLRAELGLPPEPMTPEMKTKYGKAADAGLMQPLVGKTPDQKEKILRGIAMLGIPLPELHTSSDKKLIDKVRLDLGLPPEPKSKSIRDKHNQAANVGLLLPLEAKTPAQKEKILQGIHDMSIPLPEGRTPSEKALIAKIKGGTRAPSMTLAPSEKMRRAKAEGLLTPLKGKTPDQKERILRGLAMYGIPLPELQTPSDKKLVDKVRLDLGLPPEPKTKAIRDKHNQAANVGILFPLEAKTPAQKEKILQGLFDMDIPLPEGRTPSEKALIAKIKGGPRAPSVALAPSEKMRRAKVEGLLTPLKGKTPAQKERILRGLAMYGIPLPELHTPSDKKLVDKVRLDLGLPPEPKTKAIRDKHNQAANVGILFPLEAKTPAQKEKILQGLFDMDIPLPEGRTPSEKALIAKIKGGPRAPSVALAPSEKMKKAKAEGLLTPLKGKTPAQKERILRGLAMYGIPLPELQTPSDKKLVDKVRLDLGLPPEPKTKAIRDKHNQAANVGLLLPLEAKTSAQKEKILQGLHDMDIPLPEGRTPSEKALIAKIKGGPRAPSVALAPSEKMRRAKVEGLLTPLKGKTPAQKERILRGLAMYGIPLPELHTPSDKKLVDKVRLDLGLPPEPKTKAIRDKHNQAANVGLLLPLEAKTSAQKEKILQGLHDMDIPLPEGRTPSEKALIAKIKGGPRAPSVALAPSEKMKKAKAEGLLTPLKGKTPAQKERILRGLAMYGIPLPELHTPSDKKLVDKVRLDLGLPPEPKTKAIRDKHNQAANVGLLLPLEAKTPAQKEKILQGLHDMSIPLPEGRTPSERALIAKIKAKLAPGVTTPLEGKSPEQKEKILRAMAMNRIPLPEGKTPSDKKIIDKVRAELGMPPDPKTASLREKYDKAHATGLISPLEGKSAAQKEKILRGEYASGLPLPEGRTASEKALIAKIKAGAPPSVTTEKIRKAKAAGLLTPLAKKSPEQRDKILRGLAKAGLPLPEGRSPSEKALIQKLKKEFGLPDRTPSEKLRRAKAAGLLTPLEGKTPAQREKILRGRAAAGLPIPEGRSPSERALVQKIKDDTGLVTPSPSERLRRAKVAGLLTPLKGKPPAAKEKILKDMLAAGVPIPQGETPSEKELIKKLIAGPPPAKKTRSERTKQAKAAGFLTPLKGKTPEQKEKILKGLIKAGLPLPEAKSPSERNLIDRIRDETGLPPEPKTPSLKERYRKALEAGLITPLQGKTSAEREKILKKLQDTGIPLPEGRTPTEKSIVKRVRAGAAEPKAPSEKSPLTGKTPAQKEKILRGLVKSGIPLPEGKTQSDKDVINKVRKDMGLPPEPKSPSMREKLLKAHLAGIVSPLEGKTPPQKQKVLKGLYDAGIPLPEGRTPSEKSMIAKISGESKRKAKPVGLVTPLEGKSAAEKEKIIRGLAEAGLPLPEVKTASEKSMLHKIRTELGIPPPAKTSSEKAIVRKAKAAGFLTPITGKAPAEKERILRGLAEAGLPLPVGKTASEKDLIKKVRAEVGLSAEPTASEKLGMIKTKTKKVGAAAAKKVVKGSEAETCDRGCGCDKKKIRFKHSYIKIRVTSPDISAFCPCPEECIPGVKAGAFIDNEGIKVTVGRAIGVPSYPRVSSHQLYVGSDFSHTYTNSYNSSSTFPISKRGTGTLPSSSNLHYDTESNSFESSCNSIRPYSTESDNNYLQRSTPPYEGRSCHSVTIVKSSSSRSSDEIFAKSSILNIKTSVSSFDSILVIKSETSLSLSRTSSNTSDTMSVVSGIDSSVTSASFSTQYYQSSGDLVSISSIEDSEDAIISDEIINETSYISDCNMDTIRATGIMQPEYMAYMMTDIEQNIVGNEKKKSKCNKGDPVMLLNHVTTKIDLAKVVDRILARQEFSGASSIFIVVPTSDNEGSSSTGGSQSSISNALKSRGDADKEYQESDGDIEPRASSEASRKFKKCRRTKKFYMQEIDVASVHDKETMFNNEPINVFTHKVKKNKDSKKTANKMTAAKKPPRKCVVSTDTTIDRPCCCCPPASGSTITIQSISTYDDTNLSSDIDQLFLQKGPANLWAKLPELHTKSSCSVGLPPKTRGYQLPATVTRCHLPSTTVPRCHSPVTLQHSCCRNPYRQERRDHSYDYEIKPKRSHRHKKDNCKCAATGPLEIFERAARSGKRVDLESIICDGSGMQTQTSMGNRDPSLLNCTASLDCTCLQEDLPENLDDLCPCEQHYRVSHVEPGSKMGTQSRGILTEIKLSSSLKKAKSQVTSNPLVQTSSNNMAKKTRFSSLILKTKSKRSKVIIEPTGPTTIPIKTDTNHTRYVENATQVSILKANINVGGSDYILNIKSICSSLGKLIKNISSRTFTKSTSNKTEDKKDKKGDKKDKEEDIKDKTEESPKQNKADVKDTAPNTVTVNNQTVIKQSASFTKPAEASTSKTKLDNENQDKVKNNLPTRNVTTETNVNETDLKMNKALPESNLSNNPKGEPPQNSDEKPAKLENHKKIDKKLKPSKQANTGSFQDCEPKPNSEKLECNQNCFDELPTQTNFQQPKLVVATGKTSSKHISESESYTQEEEKHPKPSEETFAEASARASGISAKTVSQEYESDCHEGEQSPNTLAVTPSKSSERQSDEESQNLSATQSILEAPWNIPEEQENIADETSTQATPNNSFTFPSNKTSYVATEKHENMQMCKTGYQLENIYARSTTVEPKKKTKSFEMQENVSLREAAEKLLKDIKKPFSAGAPSKTTNKQKDEMTDEKNEQTQKLSDTPSVQAAQKISLVFTVKKTNATEPTSRECSLSFCKEDSMQDLCFGNLPNPLVQINQETETVEVECKCPNEPDANTMTGTDVKTSTKTKTGSDTKIKTAIKTSKKAKAGVETKTSSDSKSSQVTKSGSDTKVSTEAKNSKETKPSPENKPGPETKLGPETKPATATKTGADTKPGAVTKPGGDTKAGPETKNSKETKPGSDTKISPENKNNKENKNSKDTKNSKETKSKDTKNSKETKPGKKLKTGKKSKTQEKETITCGCGEAGFPATASKATSDNNLPPGVLPAICAPPEGFAYVPGMIPEFPYDVTGPSCGWIDTGELMKLRSEMTLSTSGFTIKQKKKIPKNVKPKNEIELDFEDAIRYYANTFPEKFQDIMRKPYEHEALVKKPEEPPKPEEPAPKVEEKPKKGIFGRIVKVIEKEWEKDKEKIKKIEKLLKEDASKSDKPIKEDASKSDNPIKEDGTKPVEPSNVPELKKSDASHPRVTCECPYGSVPPALSYQHSDSESSHVDPHQGFKFYVGGKGSAAPHLGFLCFDMVQESFESW